MTDVIREQNHSELVKVFDSMQESQTQVIVALLEAAGIECMEISREAVQNMYPGVGATLVLVSPEDAEEATRIIAESRASAESDLAQVPFDDATQA